uniref:Uncharacterized conserved protein, DUF433 family n=1 Tax=Candidatus Kentrum sp. UNK TaxID=2126344 RepID=A0A451AXT4_9GAMM|nr:MAG: Uncharacterized conserved protein, DUF433 family [Candidatus Kentron sp. UNK]VFK70860.1 MAG: Uncharacterized conserved protein, DUF433 family [Candidatus Kentron sp. UNK]
MSLPANDLDAIEAALHRLSRGERAAMLTHLIEDLAGTWPGIESSPDVCGGEARIVRTRIPVWLLVQARRLGSSEADLLIAWPTLRAEDLAYAWRYARAHADEIQGDIKANED